MAVRPLVFPDVALWRDPSYGASCFLKGERLVSPAHSIPGHMQLEPMIAVFIRFNSKAQTGA